MKKLFIILVIFWMPVALMAQATPQLISKANGGDPVAMVTLAQCYEHGAGVEVDSSRALQLYQQALDKGNGDAVVALSYYYLMGSLVPVDTLRSYQLCKEWADKGCPDAIAALGNCYQRGYGVQADTARYMSLLQQAAKKGSPLAYEQLGKIYEYGLMGKEVDLKKAETYSLKAFKSGRYAAAVSLARLYRERGDYATALHYLNEALPWGLPMVVQEVAETYYMGYGVPEDEARAQKMMADLVAKFHNLHYGQFYAGWVFLTPSDESLRDVQRALDYWKQGDARNSFYCQHSLANYYRHEGDMKQAAYYYDRILARNDREFQTECGEVCLDYAAMLHQDDEVDQSSKVWQLLNRGMTQYGNADCAVMLANFEMESESPDAERVRKYYRKADQLGDKTALGELGRFYVTQGNVVTARSLFQEMISKGNPDGYYWLAMLHDYEGNTTMSINTFEKGGKAGSSLCYEALGQIYEEAIGIAHPNYEKALSYYAKAGTDKAFYKQGLLYLQGQVGKQSKKDISKGLSLVRRSADNGYIDAIYTMGYMYETGQYVDSVDHFKAVSYYRQLADNDVPSGLFKMGLYHEVGDGGIPYDTIQCVEYYRRAAELGYGDAWCYLGDFYRLGHYLPLDKEQAFYCYQTADSLGSVSGCYYMGRSYLEGCGVPVDSLAAIPYLQVAAQNGVGQAAYLLAEFYNFHKAGLTANADSALYYYMLAHENGSGEASYFLAYALFDEGNYAEAFKYAVNAAERENEDGLFLLALMIQQGVGCEADPATAYHILENITHQYNDSRAYLQVGLARLQGLGCEEDEAMGKRYLDTAAWMGNVSAPFYEAICCLNGYGCEADTLAAVGWLKSGDELGDAKCANRLGDVYYQEEVYDTAFYYYQRSADRGNLDGYCDLGYCYQQGQGTVLNSQKAYELYMYAAERNFARGCMLVANCYVEGIYVEESDATAQKWYMKAAELGSAQGAFYVAAIYEQGGTDVARNLKQAKEWYKRSAAMGYPPAEAALNRLK